MSDQTSRQNDPGGDDPMTSAQASHIDTLANETGEDIPEGLTKAAASERIDQLRAKAGSENPGTAGPDIGIGEPNSDMPPDDDISDDGPGDKPFKFTPVPPNTTR